MTERVPQVNELLRKEIGAILLRELDVEDGVLATLTRVEATPNLQSARVYISVMPEEKGLDFVKSLKYQVYQVQQELNRRLKMRPVPKIEWRLETKTAEAHKIEKLLDSIKKEG
ncbi:MAG: ribosome-binding factor A [Candidatus Wildermuthbacteria bacterium]|nr:ribosome-binding factor A [Candidatus Wildermuthbacteria bacterium]